MLRKEGMNRLFSYLFLTCVLCCFTNAMAADPTVLSLRGYLGKEDLASARKTIDTFDSSASQALIIEVNSTSGELSQVLELAKKIYFLKIQHHTHIITYIEENAIGPAAIIPFLADDLYTSLFVSWGDIPHGNETALSTNVLRNQVLSFISPDYPHSDLLKMLAAAMSDSSVQLIDDNGWKILSDATDKTHPRISTPGEPLVINQNQLRQLDLVKGIIPLEQFYQLMHISTAQQPPLVPLSSLAISSQNLETKLAEHVKFNPNAPNFVGHIVIDDRTNGINESTWLYVQQALKYYKKVKPICVVLELNTPGGEVYAAQKISDALKQVDIQDNIPVIAFINNWAISAGAMLGYSCRFIAITKDAAMGAAEPVLAGTTGEMKEASEKVNSALRTDFANRASFFGRNPDIAEAMVDKDIILVLRHGRITRLSADTQIRNTGSDPDIIISPKGKLLTLNAEQLMQYGVADMLLPPVKLEPITELEQEKGKWPASKTLLFQQPYFAKIPTAVIDEYRMDWKTRFFVILASPVVSSILMLGLMMGLYLEFSNPGVTFPGIVGGLCLFLIILSSLSLDIANWLEVILLVSGLLIIVVDLFLLPTFGLLGIVGALLFFAGLLGMLLPGIGSVNFDYDSHSLNIAGYALLERLAWLCGTLIVGILLILLLSRYVTPNFKAWNRLVLTGHEQNGYIAGESPQMLPPAGTQGEALTTLRPAGKVLINDKIYDALTAGNFIEKGMPIVVIRLEGSVIIVDTPGSSL